MCNVPKTTDAKQSIYRITMTLLQSSITAPRGSLALDYATMQRLL